MRDALASIWSGSARVSAPVELLQHPGRPRLLVRRRLHDVLHRRDRDSRRGASSQWAESCSREPLADRRQQRLAVREPVGVRAEARHRRRAPGRPMRSQSCAKRRSFAAAIISSPSCGREHLVRCDQRERRAVAAGRDAGSARRSAGSRRARGRCRRGRRSTSRPRPVCTRSSSAATIPSAAHTPVPMSMTDAPTRTPGRSGSPVMLTMPGERLHQRVVARAAGERPAPAERADRAVDEPRVPRAQRLAAEPVPLRRARRASTGRRRRRRSTSRSSASCPRSSLKSSASERFDAFAAKNITLPPSKNRGPQARASSPRRGCSTLTTSAPSAPRISVQVGPASDDVRSTTRIPCSGAKLMRPRLPKDRAMRADCRNGGR